MLTLTPDECEVFEILSQFPQLVLKFEALKKPLPFSWGSKKRRSVLDNPPPPILQRVRFHLHPQSSNLAANANGGGGPASDSDSLPVAKADASSPATPLSFSPSESDERPAVSRRKIPLKRKREDYLNKIDELTKSRGLLLGEIANVKRYFDDLKAYNLKLRARRDELSSGLRIQDNPSMKIIKSSQVAAMAASVNSSSSFMTENQYLEFFPYVVSERGESSQGQLSPTTSFPSASVVVHNADVGPLGIPDLNVPLEDTIPQDASQPFDLGGMALHMNRALAAQARQKRIQINRVKNNSMGINKPRSIR